MKLVYFIQAVSQALRERAGLVLMRSSDSSLSLSSTTFDHGIDPP